MDIFPLDGLPYPAMPPARAGARRDLAKYAALGCVPLVIPSIVEDVPIPIERIPRHQGTDYAYIKALAARGRLRLLHRPGPGARREHGLLGPGDPARACRSRRSTAASTARTTTSRRSRFTFDKEKKELPVVFVQEPYSKAPIPIPIPDITPLNPPLGVVPPLPPKITLPHRHGQAQPARRDHEGHRLRRPALRLGLRHRAARRRPLRPRAAVAPARRRARRRATRSTASTTSPTVTHQIKRGSYTQSFGLARNALLSTVPVVPT